MNTKNTETTTKTYEGQGIDRLFDFEEMLDQISCCLRWTRIYEAENIRHDGDPSLPSVRMACWRARILERPELLDLMFPPGSAVRLELGF